MGHQAVHSNFVRYISSHLGEDPTFGFRNTNKKDKNENETKKERSKERRNGKKGKDNKKRMGKERKTERYGEKEIRRKREI